MKQTYISREIDVNGKAIDFERWTCKKPATIKSKYEKVYSNSSMFQMLCRVNKIMRIDVYRTPDGYNAEEKPCYSFAFPVVPAT